MKALSFLVFIYGIGVARGLFSPLSSLRRGEWTKFISGAANQDLPFIANLSYLYTRAGVDCIDASADVAVLSAVREGINAALEQFPSTRRPLVMVSINDGDDVHFRKASFTPQRCPPDCKRPCERICPAVAIAPKDLLSDGADGVDKSKCYGCGRCIAVCPLGLITTQPFPASMQSVREIFSSGLADAIEIHTPLEVDSADSFRSLWQEVGDVVSESARIVSVSFPDRAELTAYRLALLQDIMQSHTKGRRRDLVHVWQCDGRPMSGDIGNGTVHASISLAKKLLVENRRLLCDRGIDFDSGRHFAQLAGGVNAHAPTVARREGLTGLVGFGGYAFGGFARKQLIQHFRDRKLLDLASLCRQTDDGAAQLAAAVVGSVRPGYDA